MAVQGLKESAPVYNVRQNKFRNYEHEGTGFLFDRATRKVYGRQKNDGSIAQLTIEDIEKCHNLGFDYQIPVNLTSNKDKEEEEDEDEEIQESDEEEEEEEEDDE